MGMGSENSEEKFIDFRKWFIPGKNLGDTRHSALDLQK